MEAATADNGKQVRDLLQDALNHLNRADFAKGEVALLNTLDQHPDEPDALQLLGVLRRAQGKIEEAEDLFRRSLALRPDQPHVWHNLGNLVRVAGRHDEGIDALREAIRLKPNYAEAWFNLGIAYYSKGALDDAEKAYRQALKIQPNYAMAKQNLAVVLNDLRRPKEAEAILLQALAAGSRDRRMIAGFQHNLAMSAKMQRRYADALRWFDQAQAILPDLPNVDNNRGHLLELLGGEEDALIAYRRALALNPLDTNSHRDLNTLLYRMGRDEEFLRSYDDAAATFSDKAALPLAKGQMLLLTDQHEKALESLSRASELEPENPAAHDLSGLVYARLGRFEDARTAHERALAIMPGNAHILCNYATSLLGAGDARAALEAVEKARAAMPNHQGAIALWGTALRAAGDDREAAFNDYENLVQTFDLAPPEGYSDMESFNRDLDAYLTRLHRDKREYPGQSLRGGTQTLEDLIGAGHDLVERLRMRFDEAMNEYIARMKDDSEHPLFSRRASGFVYAGSWSSRMKDCGHHVNHVHSTAWISSVYYVSVPEGEGGVLKFGEPPFETPFQNLVRKTVQPKAGTLVLFPSYMWHGTTPLRTEAHRTTIAFDALPR